MQRVQGQRERERQHGAEVEAEIGQDVARMSEW